MLSAHGLIPVYRGVCIPYFKIKRERERRERKEREERAGEREERERERERETAFHYLCNLYIFGLCFVNQ